MSFLLNLLSSGLIASSSGTPSSSEVSPSDVDFSVGLASRYMEIQKQDEDIRTKTLYGAELVLRVFPHSNINKYFFLGFGAQFLTNHYKQKVDYDYYYFPFGLDFDKFGVYYSFGSGTLKGYHEKELYISDDDGIYIYFKTNNLYLHIGKTNLRIHEKDDTIFSYHNKTPSYVGESFNVSLQYTF